MSEGETNSAKTKTNSAFRERFANTNRIFIFQGRLGARLSFYGV